MRRDFEPVPDPAGSLEPPRRYPPTAVGAATPLPEPQPRRVTGSIYFRGHDSALARAAKLAIALPVTGAIVAGKAIGRVARRIGRRTRRTPAR